MLYSKWQLIEAVLESAENNYLWAHTYSWRRNYQDNACRLARAHAQGAKAMEFALCTKEPTAHEVSYYLGKGASIAAPETYDVYTHCVMTAQKLRTIGLSEEAIDVDEPIPF
jgi:hypothetical protein